MSGIHEFREGELIHLAPYICVFGTYCKRRWIGRELLSVLVAEFVEFDAKGYMRAAREGRVLVLRKRHIHAFLQPTGEPPTKTNMRVDRYTQDIGTFVLCDSDLILHLMHRHEPPIIGSLNVIEQGNQIFCVKPSSIPIHPCGRYRFQSVNEKLTRMGYNGLRACNRLDKLVSGLVILARSAQDAEEKRVMAAARSGTKVYLARTIGQHSGLKLVWAPLGITIGNNSTARTVYPSSHDALLPKERYARFQELYLTASGRYDVFDDYLLFPSIDDFKQHIDNDKQLVELLRMQVGSYKGSSEIEEHQTALSIIFYLPGSQSVNSTLALCIPVTGRTHQLRLHLQYAGSPIIDDPCHGGLPEHLQLIRTVPSATLLAKMLDCNPYTSEAYVDLIVEKIKECHRDPNKQLDISCIREELVDIHRSCQRTWTCDTCLSLQEEVLSTTEPFDSSLIHFNEDHGSYNIRPTMVKNYMFKAISLHAYSYIGETELFTELPVFTKSTLSVTEDILQSFCRALASLKLKLLMDE
ncbi:DRAP deaminase [Giardia muris]|uniref:DRAP deaminase n=1 Tax=Giardia muris TaxID=5742 RepID=A0A4Z1SUZ0_GIAMU|nr:DRAP deaminase [Giardia muris]|eukprot:TNJ29702.1 DRAP deaminase [Giardia muris]